MPHTGPHLWQQLEAGLEARCSAKDGRRPRRGLALFLWAPDGESPATSPGPTGRYVQALIQALLETLPKDAARRAIVVYLEACPLGANSAASQTCPKSSDADCLQHHWVIQRQIRSCAQGAISRNANVRSMHADMRVLLRPGLLGCADVPTTGLDWLLQQRMELLLDFLEVPIALLSTVCDFQEVACFGTQAMRVRWHFAVSRMFQCACSACQLCRLWMAKADEQQLTMLLCVLLSSLLFFCGAATL